MENSADQTILTNYYNQADMDFHNRAAIFEQPWYGNTVWKEAESLIDPALAFFTVSSDDPSDGWVPADDWEPQLLFVEDSEEDDAECTLSTGPRSFSQNYWLCYYIAYLEGLKNTNFKAYWIGTYQLLRRYALKLPQDQWPLCLWEYQEQILDCGVKELMQLDAEYRAMLESAKQDFDQATENYSSSEDLSETEYSIVVSEFQSIRTEHLAALSSLREEQRIAIAAISCTEEMYSIWKNVYLILLKQQDEALDEGDINVLRSAASLCPAIYGDVVHWADGLLYMIDALHRSVYNDCSDGIEERESTNYHSNAVRLFPNPASDLLNIESSEAARIIVRSINGSLLDSREMNKTLKINTAKYSVGLYLIETIYKDGISEINKIVIQR